MVFAAFLYEGAGFSSSKANADVYAPAAFFALRAHARAEFDTSGVGS